VAIEAGAQGFDDPSLQDRSRSLQHHFAHHQQHHDWTRLSSAPARAAERLALHLAQAGKNILILERGPFLPQEKLNWDTSAVFLDNRYHTKETWQDKDGKDHYTPSRPTSWGARPRFTAQPCSACGPKTLASFSIRAASPLRGPSPTLIWSPSIPAPKSFFTSTAILAPHPRFPADMALL
jgi:hypothetical protein